MKTKNNPKNILNKAKQNLGASLSKTQNVLTKTSQKIKDLPHKSLKAETSPSPLGKVSLDTSLVKPGNEKAVGYWLLGLATLVFGLICFGAYIRLIKLGHSVTGLHPMEWKGEFDSLQKYVEHYLWRKPPQGYSLTFLDEYLSTILEKVIGLCFIVPFSYFLLTGRLMSKLRNRCFGLIAMQFLQGYIGAWMAVHELGHRPSFKDKNIVDTHRMFVHWNTTMIMFAVLVWNGLSLIRSRSEASEANRKDMLSMKTQVLTASLIHALNFATGVMVAGVDGSKKFNTFPLMDGRVIPHGYLHESPIWKDIFENIATVQFHHRIFAYGTYITAAYLFMVARKKNLTKGARRGIWALFAIVNIQLVDGLAVLFTKGHWLPGVMHQSNAIFIVTASLFLLHTFFQSESRAEEQLSQQSETPKASDAKPARKKAD